MRKWGWVVTLLYGCVVLALVIPAAVTLVIGFDSTGWTGFSSHLRDAYTNWLTWVTAAVPVTGEAVLLFLRVDTTQKRLKPRTHVMISAATSGVFLAILTLAAVLAVGVAIRGDKYLPDSLILAAAGTLLAWLAWTVVFYRLYRNSADAVSGAVSWLLRGSVLELLIVVPAHIIVRRRHDCSAPVATSFGITSGIAIMLLAFGPGVLLLYKQRMEKLSLRASASSMR